MGNRLGNLTQPASIYDVVALQARRRFAER